MYLLQGNLDQKFKKKEISQKTLHRKPGIQQQEEKKITIA